MYLPILQLFFHIFDFFLLGIPASYFNHLRDTIFFVYFYSCALFLVFLIRNLGHKNKWFYYTVHISLLLSVSVERKTAIPTLMVHLEWKWFV